MKNKKNIEKPKKSKAKIGDIISYIFVGLAACIFAFSIYVKSSGEVLTIFGKQARLVLTDSMAPSDYTDDSQYKIKSFKSGVSVIIETCPVNKGQDTYFVELNQWVGENVEVGDVLTFSYSFSLNDVKIITHRVININEYEDGYQIQLQGDNKSEAGNTTVQTIYTNSTDTHPFNYIIGEVVRVDPVLGFITHIFTSKIVLFFLIIVPLVIFIIYKIIYLIVQLDKLKKDSQAAADKKKDDEIAALRSQLEDMKKKGGLNDKES